jgi:hybrid cluster-associated redox disulfide protein
MYETRHDVQPAGQITPNCLVQEVVERHPQTITVFCRHGLQCVGCYVSPFHTIADSAREYNLGIEPLLAELNQAVASGGA